MNWRAATAVSSMFSVPAATKASSRCCSLTDAVERPRLVEGAAEARKSRRREGDDAGLLERVGAGDLADQQATVDRQRLRRVRLVGRKGQVALGLVDALLADQRFEQRLLGVEIGVERSLGDAGRARDVVHAGGVETRPP